VPAVLVFVGYQYRRAELASLVKIAHLPESLAQSGKMTLAEKDKPFRFAKAYFQNLLKSLILERAVPTISANVSWLIFGSHRFRWRARHRSAGATYRR
jgi:hypothetical protein